MLHTSAPHLKPRGRLLVTNGLVDDLTQAKTQLNPSPINFPLSLPPFPRALSMEIKGCYLFIYHLELLITISPPHAPPPSVTSSRNDGMFAPRCVVALSLHLPHLHGISYMYPHSIPCFKTSNWRKGEDKAAPHHETSYQKQHLLLKTSKQCNDNWLKKAQCTHLLISQIQKLAKLSGWHWNPIWSCFAFKKLTIYAICIALLETTGKRAFYGDTRDRIKYYLLFFF